MIKYYALINLFCFLVFGSTNAQVSLTDINAPYNQDFNTLGSNVSQLYDGSTLPAGWSFLESGTNANNTYGAGIGSSTTGNTYSFGSADATDRAFGGLQSGSLIPIIGGSFLNETNTTITSLQITYRGEQWRLGATGRTDRLDFQYSLNATTLNSGTWSHVDELDFITPATSGGPALNGNLEANSTSITFTIDGLNIANGSTFFIRWTDFNPTGSDDGLAIDDFSIIPSGIPTDEPSISFSPATLAFGEVNAGSIRTLQYEVIGSNLEAPILISVSNSAYTLSADGTAFTPSVSIPDTGAIVYVRFSPIGNGISNAVLTHTSAAYTKDFSVTGSGFVQAENIIPISTARAQSAGTKVTVAGRITVANEQGNPAYLQDATGGIPVFDISLATDVAIGDSVIVTGPIGIFNDQKQISGTGIFYTKIATTPRFVIPKPIALADLAAHEGQLVTVQNVELVNKSFVFYPQSTERITDGTSSADLRIDGDTNIPGLVKPQAATNITGVVGRFRTNAQLLPRFQQDIPGATEPTAPSDSIPRTKTLDVVNWNIEFFGARREDYPEEFGPADEELQFQNVKRVLDTLNADIILVEEVSDQALLSQLVAQLEGYALTCSDRYSRSFEGPSSDFPPQKLCFIYDTNTIALLSARPMFEGLYDSARTIDPSLLPGIPGGNPSSFYSSGRLPYLITVNATIEGVTEKITLIGVHAKSGAASDDRNRREYDAQVLKDSLDAHFATEKLIYLGDLNDDLDQSIATGLTTPYASFVNDTAYAPITKALSDVGARSTVSFNDVIDHQIISDELEEPYLEGSAQIIAPFRLIENYATTTSDHLPVISRYAFKAPVARFVQNSSTVTEDTTQVIVRVELNRPATSDTQIQISLSGSATIQNDFTTEPGAIDGTIRLNFSVGQTSSFFTINIVDDKLDELSETAMFTLLPSTGVEIGDQSHLVVTIEDNDVPTIAFTSRLVSREEGSGPYTVKLKMSTPVASEQTVTLDLYALPGTIYGTDFTTEPAAINNSITLVMPAGSAEAHFTITPLEDRRRELLLEPVSFYLDETSEGLIATSPRIFVFTIIDSRRRPEFVVFPNPTAGIAKLISEDVSEDEIIQLDLRNDRGESILRSNGTLKDLNDRLSQKLQNSRKGIYTLNLTVNEERYLLRILKL